MSINIMQCFEYQLECDICGAWEVVHTGDSDGHYSNEYVHDRRTALRVCGFHESYGQIVCDKCFKKRKNKQ